MIAPRFVLPFEKEPKLYAEDDRRFIRVDPAETIFGTSAFSEQHRLMARIIKKAMADAHLDFYWVEDLLTWALGEKYRMLKLCEFASTLKKRWPFKVEYDIERTSVYRTFRMMAEWWKIHKKPTTLWIPNR